MAVIVVDTRRCKEIVKDLLKDEFISLDCEGINLGKDGPLTLLQIGSQTGNVYLFDVMENRRMFDEGELKRLLESENVVKVIHSSKGDSAALYHQFGVHLQNVFDTQIAHLVIEEAKGRKLPRSLKLEDLCNMYSDYAMVLDQKDIVKEKFVREIGDYWARRPLTREMIDYASKDAAVLIPVYRNQKELIETRGLSRKYQDRVHGEINYSIDDRCRKEREKRLDATVKEVLENFPAKYSNVTRFSDITDDDDLHALSILRYGSDDEHPLVTRLKTESIKAQLEELDDQLREEGNRFLPKSKSYGFLKSYMYHPDDGIKKDARRIIKSIEEKVLEIMTQKFNLSTKFEHLSPYEKDALKQLKPRGENDPKVHPTHLYLYWLVKEYDLDSTMKRLDVEGRSYEITEGFYKWLRFCYSGPVPSRIKQKAKAHLKKMDKEFGRGNIPTKRN